LSTPSYYSEQETEKLLLEIWRLRNADSLLANKFGLSNNLKLKILSKKNLIAHDIFR
jgi:hypothetical protein